MKKKKNNFKQNIINVWQGKLSLTKTFWLVFVVGGTIMTIPSFIVTDAYVDSIGQLAAIFFLLFFVFQYIYLIWAYVATWRSASNYKPKKGQWSWGTIAKVYIVFNLINAVYRFLQ